MSPDGANAYVANQAASGRIAQFSIGADGALSALDPRSSPTGSLPEGVVATADGVYVANLGDDTISQYDAGPGGALEAKTAGPSPARRAPSASRSRPTARASTSPLRRRRRRRSTTSAATAP